MGSAIKSDVCFYLKCVSCKKSIFYLLQACWQFKLPPANEFWDSEQQTCSQMKVLKAKLLLNLLSKALHSSCQIENVTCCWIKCLWNKNQLIWIKDLRSFSFIGFDFKCKHIFEDLCSSFRFNFSFFVALVSFQTQLWISLLTINDFFIKF